MMGGNRGSVWLYPGKIKRNKEAISLFCLSKESYDAFYIRSEHGNSTLHLHGIYPVGFGSVVSEHIFQFCILGFYFVPFRAL